MYFSCCRVLKAIESNFAEMESPERQKANGTKLCRLLIDKGTEAVRKVFERIYPPASWKVTLKSYDRKNMKKIIPKLNTVQLNILYPPSGDPSSSQDYDITLLFILLRNICGLSPPLSTNSWDKEPPSCDESEEADLARIKFYRNKIYGHITTTSICNKEFQQYWMEISDALVRLGTDTGDLQYLKTAPLENDLYVEKLKEWKENEDKIEVGLRSISDELATTQATNKRWFFFIAIQIVVVVVLIVFMFWYLTNPQSDRGNVKHIPTMYLPAINDSTFVGRQWLFHELEDHINSSHNVRGILIVGEPGLGKSSIMRQLIITPESSHFIHNNIIAYHFCKFDEKETRSVGLLVKKIVNLFKQKIPEMAAILRNDTSKENELDNCESYPHSCFQIALLEPLQNLREPPTVAFIVIDALDECSELSEDSYDSSILQILHSKGINLPKWIKFVFSSRNITTVIGKLSEIDVTTLHILSTDKRNLLDIRSFIENSLKSNSKHIPKETGLSQSIDVLSQQAQGNFLFVKTILEIFNDNPESLYKKNVFSTVSLGRLYALSFRERYKVHDFEQMQPLLEVLLASVTPLTVNELENILQFQHNVHDTSSYVKKVIKQISPYLVYNNDGTVRFYHQSFSNWLMNQTEGIKGLFIQKSSGHRLIATYLLNQFDNVNNKPNLKQFSHLSMHILYAGMIKEHIDKMLTFNVSQILDANVNRTILHELAKVKGSTRILEVYIKELEIVDINDKIGCPPSFYAAQEGNIDNLELLIRNGADVNYVNDMYGVSTSPTEIDSPNRENSLTFITAEIGSTEMAKILLANGAKFDEVNRFGQKPVDVAVKYGHIELVEMLINHGFKADHVALHHAAARNHTQIVEYLLKTGNVRDTCLSCTPGNISSCYTSRNISVHQTHLCFCETALYAAVSRGYTQIVKLLLRYGNESLECKHYSGKTPLMDAVERNDRNMVEFLLTNGADVNVQCTNEMSYNKLGLRYECFFRGFHANTNEKNFLYTSYCDRPVCYNGMGITHLCARQGLWEMIEYSVSRWNANLVALDNFHLSIIDYATIHDHTDFITKFRATYPLESSILYNLSYVLDKKQTLQKITTCGSIETLRLFYSENNNKSFSENYNEGTTLLHLATKWSPYPRPPDGPKELYSIYKEIFSCTEILNYNFSVGYTITTNYFPDKVLKREYKKRLKVVKLLTKREGNIDSKDADGRTALHYAALNGFVGAVRHLVREGSDWKVEDKNGFTPLRLALAAAPLESVCRFYFFRTPNCQNTNNDNYFQSCKSTVYDHTVSYLIRLHNTSLNECNKETKAILKSTIWKNLHLSLYSLFENGVKVNCGGGLKTHLRTSQLLMTCDFGDMSEVFKNFQVNVSESCGVPFSESEIHLMAYLGMPSEIGNFFKPSYNNRSFPLQRLVDHHPKGFRFLDECYDDEGYLPFHRAVKGGNIDAVQWFLELGVDMWRKTKSGWTCLDLAIYLLVPDRFGNKDIKIREYSIFKHFYSVHHVHHSLLYRRYSNNDGLSDDDFRKHVNIVRNVREKIFDKLLEKAFKTTSPESLSMLQSWCKRDSTELSPLHIAASLGMEMLHGIHKELQSVGGKYSLRCHSKHNIEPLYLAYLYDSVEGDENLREVFLEKDNFAKLSTKYPPNTLKYPDREAEYHLIYNYFYNTPDEKELLKYDLSGLFQCKNINDFLPEIETLDKRINRCYQRCKKSVFFVSDQFLSTYAHVSVEPLFDLSLFDFPEYLFEYDFINLNAHLAKIRHHGLKTFYEISSKLWRHISKAYECSYRCRCAEAKLQLLEQFTSQPRENRKVGKFVAERMGWSNTSLDGHVSYRWPFRFLLNKALGMDRDFDYLKIFGDNFEPFHYFLKRMIPK